MIADYSNRLTMITYVFWFVFIITFSGNVGGKTSFPTKSYFEFSAVNSTKSLENIKQLVLKQYQLAHEGGTNRNQIGILGVDVYDLFPDTVDVVSRHSSQRNRSEAVNVTYIPVVDKIALILHAVAAFQEMVKKYELKLMQLLDISDHENLSIQVRYLSHKIEETVNIKLVELTNMATLDEIFSKHQLEYEIENFEAERKSIEVKTQEKGNLLRSEEDFFLKKISYESDLMRESLTKKLQLELQLSEQRENLRRETELKIQSAREEFSRELEYKRVSYEKEKITTELETRAKQEMANEDATVRKIQLQAQLETERMVHIIRSVFLQSAVFLSEVFSRPQLLLLYILVIYGVVIFLSSTRQLLIFYCNQFLMRLNKPSLVRETSYQSSFLTTVQSLYQWCFPERNDKSIGIIEAIFHDVVLSPNDKLTILQLAQVTRNCRKISAPYRHVILYGPPGNGKSLIARRLALSSGMDYAIMSGGDIGPLAGDAVTQLHDLFRWASNSKRGLLIFIDEAEAFLGIRFGGNRNDTTENIRNAMNALLFQTGSHSKNFMLILATNRPNDIDDAVMDRMDVSLHINFPGLSERLNLIRLYYDIYIKNFVRDSSKFSWIFRKQLFTIENDFVTEKLFSQVADLCEGFSGRELSKLFLSIQYAMRTASDRHLTGDMFQNCVIQKVNEHRQRRGMKIELNDNKSV